MAQTYSKPRRILLKGRLVTLQESRVARASYTEPRTSSSQVWREDGKQLNDHKGSLESYCNGIR